MTRSNRPALDRLVAMTFKHKVPLSTIEAIIRTEQRRRELAWHESGHAVAGIVFGGQLRTAEISDETGLTSFEPDSFPTPRMAPVAWAGGWAELRGVYGRCPTLREMYGLLACSRDEDVLCASGGTEAGRDVAPLLERCWGPIDAVAEKLNDKSFVTHADVCDALHLSRDPAARALELAMIRSGSRPGTFTVSPARQ